MVGLYPAMASTLPFDFFAGLARRMVAPRTAARHALAPLPLSRTETVFYAGLVGVLAVGLIGVLVHHRSFLVGRVAIEEAERQSRPELLGDLICENDRVIGVSVQRVFETLPLDHGTPRALPADHRVLDGALAAAHPAMQTKVALPTSGPLDPVDGPVLLQRPGSWQSGEP